jgi:hypothetical protein
LANGRARQLPGRRHLWDLVVRVPIWLSKLGRDGYRPSLLLHDIGRRMLQLYMLVLCLLEQHRHVQSKLGQPQLCGRAIRR